VRTDLAWDGRNLVLAGDAVGTVLRPYLSPSSASAILQCPARHAAERVLPRISHPMSDSELGTSGHWVLECLFNLAPADRTRQAARSFLSDLLAEVTEAHPEFAGDDGHPQRLTWLSAVWKRVIGIWLIEDPTAVAVRRTEWRLGDTGEPKEPDDDPGTGKVLIGGVPFLGVVDRSDFIDIDQAVPAPGTPRKPAPAIDPDDFSHDFDDDQSPQPPGAGSSGEADGVEIIDYKTGKATESVNPRWVDNHGDQLRLYVAAVESVDGKAPARARIAYTRWGRSRYIDLSPKAMAATVARFQQAWEDINQFAAANSYPAKPSGLCPWCPLVTSCAAAIAEGRVPNSALAASVVVVDKVAARKPRTAASDSAVAAQREAEQASLLAALLPASSSPSGPEVTPTAAQAAPSRETPGVPPTDISTERTTTRGGTMLTEDKPWEPTANGGMNPSSYSATAVFGLVSMAVSELAKADQRINGKSVAGLAGTFASIVETVQVELTGSTSPQDGMNTRLRGALHTAIETLSPLPFGGDAEAWEAWVNQVTRRTRAIAIAAINLFDNGPAASPWLDLVPQPLTEAA